MPLGSVCATCTSPRHDGPMAAEATWASPLRTAAAPTRRTTAASLFDGRCCLIDTSPGVSRVFGLPTLRLPPRQAVSPYRQCRQSLSLPLSAMGASPESPGGRPCPGTPGGRRWIRRRPRRFPPGRRFGPSPGHMGRTLSPESHRAATGAGTSPSVAFRPYRARWALLRPSGEGSSARSETAKGQALHSRVEKRAHRRFPQTVSSVSSRPTGSPASPHPLRIPRPLSGGAERPRACRGPPRSRSRSSRPRPRRRACRSQAPTPCPRSSS